MRSDKIEYLGEENKPQSEYKVVIVGMGPSGLMAAYHALWDVQQHSPRFCNILMIEKRAEKDLALRPQYIVLDNDAKKNLLNMFVAVLDDGDIKFLNNISIAPEMKISSIQRFIKRRIDDLTDTYTFLQIDYRYQTLPVVCQLGTGTITLHDLHEDEYSDVTFEYLIAADGARAETLDLVNSNLNREQQVIRKTPKKLSFMNDTYHMGTFVRLSMNNGGSLRETLPEKEFLAAYKKRGHFNLFNTKKTDLLYFLRFDKNSLYKSNEKYVNFGYIGEIGSNLYHTIKAIDDELKQIDDNLKIIDSEIKALFESISEIDKKLKRNDLDEENKKLLKDIKEDAKQQIALLTEQKIHLVVARKNLNDVKEATVIEKVKSDVATKLKIGEDEINITFTKSRSNPNKDKLKITTFKGDSQLCNKAHVSLNKHYIVLIGDSFFTPLYPLGHGLNDSFRAAESLGICIEGLASLDGYDDLLKKQAKSRIDNMSSIRIGSSVLTTKLNNIFFANALEEGVQGYSYENQIKIDGSFFENEILFSDTSKDYEPRIKKYFADKLNKLNEIMQLAIDNPDLDLSYIYRELSDEVQKLNDICENNRMIVASAKDYILMGLDSTIVSLNNFNETLLRDRNIEEPKYYENHARILKDLLSLKEFIRAQSDEINEKYMDYISNLPDEDINKKDKNGKTPLYYAITLNNTGAVKLLLERGADINLYFDDKDFIKNIPLKNLELLRILIEAGHDPFAEQNYEDPVIIPINTILNNRYPDGLIYACNCFLLYFEYPALNVSQECLNEFIDCIQVLKQDEELYRNYLEKIKPNLLFF
ncbi:hypothetical protein lpari_03224 [Legionella parisiensis]|uniref:Uncharacterized protein n=1 Tax=Legionella parisiensis TaxID=45071 RepID=A0A1E5JMN8_9GAMM|nr:ankyrin repeat domain-containing protein [Legionella parisiensis]OEH45817.1 hypothetical protein lpari_03224 [Legionella parisiensis]